MRKICFWVFKPVVLPLTRIGNGAQRVVLVARCDAARVDVHGAVAVNGKVHGVHGPRRGTEDADTGLRVGRAVARAAEPAGDAGEVHRGAVEGAVPGNGAAEVRALPVESQQATGTARTKDVAFSASQVHEPELALGHAVGFAAGLRDRASGNG